MAESRSTRLSPPRLPYSIILSLTTFALFPTIARAECGQGDQGCQTWEASTSPLFAEDTFVESRETFTYAGLYILLLRNAVLDFTTI